MFPVLSLLSALALTTSGDALAAAPLGPPRAGPKAAPLPLGTLARFPDGVLVVAGVPALDALIADLAGLSAEATGVPDDGAVRASVALHLQNDFGLDPATLDFHRPFKLALLDPKSHAAPLALVAPTLGGTWQVAFRGDPTATLDPKVRAALVAWTPKAPFALEADIAQASRIYAAELAAGGSLMRALFVTELADPKQHDEAAEAVAAIGATLDLVKDTDRLTLSADLSGPVPRLAFGVTPKGGGPLAKGLRELSSRRVAFSGMVPDAAIFAAGFNIPPALLQPDPAAQTQELFAAFDVLGQGLWSAADKAQLIDALTRIQAAQGSHSTLWLRMTTLGMAIESVTSVKDGRAYMQMLVDAGDLIYRKLWAGMKAAYAKSGVDPSTLPDMTFEQFLPLVTQFYGSGRVLHDTTAKGSRIEGMSLALDWSKVPGVAPTSQAMLSQLVGSSLDFALGGEGSAIAMAIGSGATATIGTLLAAAGRSESKVAREPWLAAASDGFGYVLVRPGDWLGAVARRPGSAPSDGGAAAGAPLLLRAKSDGKRLVFALDVPREFLGLAGLAR
ncbi:MAG: hypothetical protein U1F43_36285 [Myxococcota bacterium]